MAAAWRQLGFRTRHPVIRQRGRWWLLDVVVDDTFGAVTVCSVSARIDVGLCAAAGIDEAGLRVLCCTHEPQGGGAATSHRLTGKEVTEMTWPANRWSDTC